MSFKIKHRIAGKTWIRALCVVSTALVASVAWGQLSEYNHPELEWFTLETEHFAVHFHEGAERTARTVAKVAEEIYRPITQLYRYEPGGKVHFIVKDYEDNSNGAAYYYDNKVEVWAPAMDFGLRGTHDWLHNVVTHEFSHIISLGAARKITRRIPAFYIQAIGREDEKRPDVVLGYPDAIVSCPVAMTVVPMWFAEGMAQFQISGLGFDTWDSHRDMLLRTAWLDDAVLSMEEMGVFGNNSIGNERVYNQGYSLVLFIAEKYGQDALQKLCEAMSKPWRFTMGGAVKSALGISADELYRQWKISIDEKYKRQLSGVREQQVEGELVVSDGLGNFNPTWSPTGDRFAFVSTGKNDYLSQTSLCVYSIEDGKREKIAAGVQGLISWSPDGRQIVYSRRRSQKHGSRYFDLHVYDFDRRKEKRITKGLRAWSPDWSPDGRKLVFVVGRDGTENLCCIRIDGGGFRQLTHNQSGETLYGPRWSPDGESIVFARGDQPGRDIVLLEVASGAQHTLLETATDARDPVFSPDGSHIYFSWDQTGIFNIYRMDLGGQDIEQMTNVSGGAFMPSVRKDGHILFAAFRSDGYRIVLLEDAYPIRRAKPLASVDENQENDDGDDHSDGSPLLLNDPDGATLSSSAKPYKMTYSNLAFLPRVMFDYGRAKVGTYFYSSDVLDRYSILGGVAVNSKRDYEAFGIIEYRRLAPTIFLELYAYSLHLDEEIEILEDESPLGVNIRFDILEADLGMRYRLLGLINARAAFVHTRYTSKIGDFYFQDLRWISPSNTYYIGNHFTLDAEIDQIKRSVDSDIAPSSGRKIRLTYHYELNRFFEDFSTDNAYGTIQEVYTNYYYHLLKLDWQEHLRFPVTNHALGLRLRAGYIDRPVDSFFNLFAGGLDGMKGYPFYSIEGRKILIGSADYRFPILRDFNKRILHLTLDKLYGGFFADFGNAFDEDKLTLKDFKADVGVQLRLEAFTFYTYPTRIFFDAAYGLDEFISQTSGSTYGKQWRYYFGVAFDFLD